MAQVYKMECGCEFVIVQERPGKLPLIASDVRECRHDCVAVWDMVSKGLTKGVFQLESSLGKQWCKRLKPTCIEHLAALGAILRPGSTQCVDSKGVSATEKYCRYKNNEEFVPKIHPLIDEALQKTFSLMIYQESLMEIARVVAGFDLIDMDELRKAVSSKDQNKLSKVGVKFIDGVKNTKVIPIELGEQVWNDIKASGRYSFCKSHAWAYAINGFWSATYKYHFPLYFFTGYLRNAYEEAEPFEEIRELINEAKLFDIEVKTPSILNLKRHFDTDGEKIYFGLVDIKGVGESHFEKIKNSFGQEKQVGLDYAVIAQELIAVVGYDTDGSLMAFVFAAVAEYIKNNIKSKPTCWFEFLSKHADNIGLSTCEKLIKAGALDPIAKISRNQMLDDLNKFSLLSNTEQAWVAAHHSEYETFIDLMTGLARPKKEGGGCHNKNRLAMCLDIIKLLREPAKSLVDDANWLSWNEKLLLGESITCSKIDGCDTTEANCTCKEFQSGKGKSGKYKDFLVLAVTINSTNELAVKTGDNAGKPYLRMTVQDNTGSVDVVVWSEQLSEFSDLLFEGNVVLLMGARDKRDGFSVESVVQL